MTHRLSNVVEPIYSSFNIPEIHDYNKILHHRGDPLITIKFSNIEKIHDYNKILQHRGDPLITIKFSNIAEIP